MQSLANICINTIGNYINNNNINFINQYKENSWIFKKYYPAQFFELTKYYPLEYSGIYKYVIDKTIKVTLNSGVVCELDFYYTKLCITDYNHDCLAIFKNFVYRLQEIIHNAENDGEERNLEMRVCGNELLVATFIILLLGDDIIINDVYELNYVVDDFFKINNILQCTNKMEKFFRNITHSWLLQSGDIEVNPGPNGDMLKQTINLTKRLEKIDNILIAEHLYFLAIQKKITGKEEHLDNLCNIKKNKKVLFLDYNVKIKQLEEEIKNLKTIDFFLKHKELNINNNCNCIVKTISQMDVTPALPIETGEAVLPPPSGEDAEESERAENTQLGQSSEDVIGEVPSTTNQKYLDVVFTDSKHEYRDLAGRFVPIRTINITTGTTRGTSYLIHLPVDLLQVAANSPNALPFQQYEAFTSDIKIKIQTNINKQQKCGIRVAYYYHFIERDVSGELVNAATLSQMPNIILNGSFGTSSELIIPFKSYLPMIPVLTNNLAIPLYFVTLILYINNPLLVEAGGGNSFNLTVYGSFEGLKMKYQRTFTNSVQQIICAPQAVSALSKKPLKIVEAKSQILSKIVGALVPAASGVISGILGTNKKTSGNIEELLSTLTTSMNLDRPQDPRNPISVFQRSSNPIAHGTGSFSGELLRLDPNGTTPFPAGMIEDDSEFDYCRIASYYGQIAIFNVTTFMAAETKIFEMQVLPGLVNPVSLLPNLLVGNGVENFSPLDHVACHYNLVKTDIELMFQFICGGLDTMRVRVVYDPCVNVTDACSRVGIMAKVFDLGASLNKVTEFTMLIPYQQLVYGFDMMDGSGNSSAFSYGTIAVFVENPLVTTANNAMEVNVYKRSTGNFEGAIPRDNLTGFNIPSVDFPDFNLSRTAYFTYNGLTAVNTFQISEGTGSVQLVFTTQANIAVGNVFCNGTIYADDGSVFMAPGTNALLIGWSDMSVISIIHTGNQGGFYTLPHSVRLSGPGVGFIPALSDAPTIIKSQMDSRLLSHDGDPPIYPMSKRMLPVQTGENQTNLVSVLRRAEFYDSRDIEFEGSEDVVSRRILTVPVSFGASTYRQQQNPNQTGNKITQMHDAFRFSRGSLRYHFAISSASSNAVIMIKHVPGGQVVADETSQMVQTSAFLTSYATHLQNLHNNSVFSVEVPWYSKFNYTLNATFLNETHAYPTLASSLGNLHVIYSGPSVDFNITIYRSLGDETRMFTFMGFPKRVGGILSYQPMFDGGIRPEPPVTTKFEKTKTKYEIFLALEKEKRKDNKIVKVAADKKSSDITKKLQERLHNKIYDGYRVSKSQLDYKKTIGEYLIGGVELNPGPTILTKLHTLTDKHIQITDAVLDFINNLNSRGDICKSILSSVISIIQGLINPTFANLSCSLANLILQLNIFDVTMISNLISKFKTLLFRLMGDTASQAPTISEKKPNCLFFDSFSYMFSAITSYYDVKTNKNFSDLGLMAGLSRVSSTMVNKQTRVTSFFSDLFEFIKRTLNFIIGRKSMDEHLHDLFTSNKMSLRDWYNSVTLFCDPANELDILQDSKKCEFVYVLEEQGRKYLQMFSEMSLEYYKDLPVQDIRDAYVMLLKFKKKVGKMLAQPKERYTPFVLYMFGEPGVGKSYMMDKIAINLLDGINEVYSGNPIFTVSPGVEYLNGFLNQPAFKIDDFYFETEEIGLKQCELLMQLKTTALVNVNMAHLDEKHMVANPRLVLIASNVSHPRPPSFSDVNAIWRRRDVLCKVEIKDTLNYKSCDFCNKFVITCADCKALNIKSIKEYEHVTFTVYSNAIEEDLTKVKNKIFNYAGFCEYLLNKHKNYHNDELNSYKQRLDLGRLKNKGSPSNLDNDKIQGYLEEMNNCLTKYYKQEECNNTDDILQIKSQGDSLIITEKIPEPTLLDHIEAGPSVDYSTGVSSIGATFLDYNIEGIPKPVKYNFTFFDYLKFMFCFNLIHNIYYKKFKGVDSVYAVDYYKYIKKGETEYINNQEKINLGKMCVHSILNTSNPIKVINGKPFWVRNLLRPDGGTDSYYIPNNSCNTFYINERKVLCEHVCLHEKFSEDFINRYNKFNGSFRVVKDVAARERIFTYLNDLRKKFDNKMNEAKGLPIFKIISTITLVIGLLILVYKYFLGDSTKESQVNSDYEPTTRKIASRLTKRSGKLRNVKSQLLAVDVRRLITNNTRFMTFCDGPKRMTVQLLGICDRYCVTNTHSINMLLDNKTTHVDIYNLNNYSKPIRRTIVVKDLKICRVDNADACFVKLPKSEFFFKDIRHFFVREKNLTTNSRKGHIFSVKMGSETFVRDVNYKYIERIIHTDMVRVFLSGFEYNFEENGLCGSLLMSDKNEIMGMHIAGASGIGYAQSLCMEDFEELECLVNDVSIIESSGSINERVLIELDDQLDLVGTSSQAVYHCSKSEIMTSPMFGVLTKNKTTVPVILKDDKDIFPASTAIMEGLKHKTKVPVPFSENKLDLCIDDLSNLINTSCVPVIYPVIEKESIQNVVEGRSDMEFFKGIRMDTGAGYPWSLRPDVNQKIGLIFKDKDGKFLHLDPELKAKIERDEVDRMNGNVPLSIFQLFLKDERLPIEKCNKARIIDGSPVDLTIEIVQHFQHFVSAWQKSRLDIQHAVGINIRSMEWNKIYTSLSRKSVNNILCSDFSKFGPTIEKNVLFGVVEIINRWYSYHTNGEFNKDRFLLMCQSINAYEIFSNIIFRYHCGSPSGHALTVVVNSISVQLYMRYIWLVVTKGTRFDNLYSFSIHVEMYVYGDDFIAAVSDDVSNIFNMLSISEAFLEYGIKFGSSFKDTSFDKFVNLESATFLKHKFVQHPERKIIMMAQIKKEIVEECVNWIKKTPDVEIAMTSTARSALYLAHGHGTVYYKFVLDSLCAYFIRKNIPFNVIRWQDIDRQIYDYESNLDNTFIY